MRHLLFAFAAVTAVICSPPALADANAPAQAARATPEVRLAIDNARALALSAPAAGVAVGNPMILGVSVQNERLLFLTGRSYGSTNVVVVDARGRSIYEGRVTVVPDEAGGVILTQGVKSVRHDCNPVCRKRPDVGDDADAFSAVTGQISSRNGAAQTNR